MSTLNKAMVIGRLGADPEVKHTQTGTAVCNVSLATNNRYKDSNGEYVEETDWHRVVFWGRTAEVAGEYLRKGALIYVEGPLQTREWEDRDGVKRYTTEIKALQLTMLGNKSDGGNRGQSGPPPVADHADRPASAADINDDDLPF